jgi:hypothetical protein
VKTMAQARLEDRGVWNRPVQKHSQDDALRMLQGREVDPVVADVLHDKLSWVIGVQVLGYLRRDADAALTQWLDRIEIRTLRHGEPSASCETFSDGSQLIVVSRALQESVITMANVVVYLDIATAVSGFGRWRKRGELTRAGVARVVALLRCLLIVQRTTGQAPPVPTRFDAERTMAAGRVAAAGMMFIVAHELGHLLHGHGEASAPQIGSVTDPVQRELQVDFWAAGLLKEILDDDDARTESMQAAFVALRALHLTEAALTVRRSRTHPEAWARWATLEKVLKPRTDPRVEGFRVALLAAIGGATQTDEVLPDELWAPIWRDERLSMPDDLSQAKVSAWDRLQTRPLDPLVEEADREATADGRALLAALRCGDVRAALAPLRRRRV